MPSMHNLFKPLPPSPHRRFLLGIIGLPRSTESRKWFPRIFFTQPRSQTQPAAIVGLATATPMLMNRSYHCGYSTNERSSSTRYHSLAHFSSLSLHSAFNHTCDVSLKKNSSHLFMWNQVVGLLGVSFPPSAKGDIFTLFLYLEQQIRK